MCFLGHCMTKAAHRDFQGWQVCMVMRCGGAHSPGGDESATDQPVRLGRVYIMDESIHAYCQCHWLLSALLAPPPAIVSYYAFLRDHRSFSRPWGTHTSTSSTQLVAAVLTEAPSSLNSSANWYVLRGTHGTYITRLIISPTGYYYTEPGQLTYRLRGGSQSPRRHEAQRAREVFPKRAHRQSGPERCRIHKGAKALVSLTVQIQVADSDALLLTNTDRRGRSGESDRRVARLPDQQRRPLRWRARQVADHRIVSEARVSLTLTTTHSFMLTQP